VDPEEMLVASIASCHRLWFLSIAAKRGWVVDLYRDTASGVMNAHEQKKFWVSQVMLKPMVLFSGARIHSSQQMADMHHEAHDECLVARSVKTGIEIFPK